MKKFFGVLAILLLLVVGYFYWTYYREYSSGSRDGVLQKFSRKGNIFKTYEGELVQNSLRGMSTKIFYFSVSDQKIADSLEKNVGKEMRLHYQQFQGALPWRGESYSAETESQNKEKDNGQYIVDRVEEVRIDYYPNQYAPQQQYSPQQPAQQQQQQQQQQAPQQPSAQQQTPQAPVENKAVAAPTSSVKVATPATDSVAK